MEKKKCYLLSAVLFMGIVLAPANSKADELSILRADHEEMSQEHEKMKVEHAEMKLILKKINTHISEHDKEMKGHQKEIKLHGNNLQKATVATPEIEAEHKKFKDDHLAEKTEHETILSALKKIEAVIIKK